MKNLVYLFSLLCVSAILFFSCTNTGKKSGDNDLKSKTSEVTSTGDGWIKLFNGTDFTGWRGYNRSDIPSVWTIEDGAIKVNENAVDNNDNRDAGDIIFDRKFKNFELTFEWKVAEGANSGVFYLAQEVDVQPIYDSAPEYQILDNLGHPDAKAGKDGNRKSASLYDMIPAVPQNAKPVGQWNTGGVKVFQGNVVHYQNGEKVVEFTLWTDEWKEIVASGKFNGVSSFINAGGENREGYIGLQDHGNDVWYRNIKIRNLD